MIGLIQVQSTFASEADARTCARGLVDAGIAACVQIIGPITSVYHWEGKACEDAEWLCQIKALSEQYDAIESYLLTNHPYETPQITAIQIDAVSEGYGEWVATTPPQQSMP